MRKISEVLRLRFACGLTQRQIAQRCAIGRATVGEYLQRAERAGLTWPLPEGLDEATLEAKLFPRSEPLPSALRPLPEWPEVHRDLQRKGVTLCLLWEEYKSCHPEGFQYSAFCERYRQWRGQLDVVMRQPHVAGEKLFVDYAGPTVPVVDKDTGEIRQAQIFVAVLSASAYTYCEATWTQTLSDWIGSHVRAFSFFGAVPTLLIPDNLKAGVTSAHLYEPDLNPTYQEMASYYGVAVIPARPYKPRDKASVEVAVQVVERWVLARLRNQTFFSLSELNKAIKALLEDLNNRPFKKLPGSRAERFQTIDRPAMRPLPETPYVYAEWRKVRVNIDYHVEIDKHYYSVPFTLVHKQLEARITQKTVEILHRGQRVASHPRSYQPHRFSTQTGHMPPNHYAYAKWTPERLIGWAEKTGPATALVVTTILRTRLHPQQGFRSCLGVLRLGKTYTEARLEAACQRALAIQAISYRSIESILKRRLEAAPLPVASTTPPIEHENLRGASYYQ
jgi:transposase